MSSMDNSQDDAQQNSAQSSKHNDNKLTTSQSKKTSKSAINHLHKKQQQSQSSLSTTSLKKTQKLILENSTEDDEKLSHHTTANDEKGLNHSLSEFQIKRAGIIHPNFSTSNNVNDALDPDRPLTDIPSPAPRYHDAISSLLNKTKLNNSKNNNNNAQKLGNNTLNVTQSEDSTPDYFKQPHSKASKWDLIASPELASHLELLQLGGLINLPNDFFEPLNDSQFNGAQLNSSHIKEYKEDKSHQLLAPLTEMRFLDLSDIQSACQKFPNLTRYGFKSDNANLNSEINVNQPKQTKKTPTAFGNISSNLPEMINDVFAPNWELILYPERFDNGVDSLSTDIYACSVATHILKQCQTRQSVNRKITAFQICQYMRSYVLSQCNSFPQFEKQYRQIRLFVGHVIVAAIHLGFKVTHASQHTVSSATNKKGKTSDNLGQPIYLNISSKSTLFNRYPNISDYYINGWS